MWDDADSDPLTDILAMARRDFERGLGPSPVIVMPAWWTPPEAPPPDDDGQKPDR